MMVEEKKEIEGGKNIVAKQDSQENESREPKQKIEKSLKGKVWVKILAPKFFEEKFLGETLANEPKNVLGRTVEAGAFEFGNPEKFYFKIFFKVDGIDGSIARTKFFGHDCSRDFLARVVHYNATRIDTNDIVQMKDAKLRIKTVSMTARQVSQAVDKELRKKISGFVAGLKELTEEEFVKKMISDELQQNIRAEVNKIYPLRAFEFRKSEVLE